MIKETSVDNENKLNLKENFAVPTYTEWEEAVKESLKGADFDKAMKTKTYDGIVLQPIYRKEDIAELPFTDCQPGSAPYIRGNDPDTYLSEGWLIAQAQDEPNLEKLNNIILKELNSGLSAVNLKLAHDDAPQGIKLKSVQDIRVALEGVDINAAPLFMQLNVDDSDLISQFETYAQAMGIEIGKLRAGIGFDPTGEFARKGYLSYPLETVWDKVSKAVGWAVDKAPNVRILSIDGSVYEAAGASSVQELGLVLSTAIGYIQGLLAQGFHIDKIAPLFQVTLSLGSNLFMEIAKVRAFRLVWAEMIQAFGGNTNSRKIWIHGKTASFNKSMYDTYVNVLRTSTEGFAGVIGGIDSLEIGCFDSLIRNADESSRRMARNQQIILKEEAHFAKVVDPAGGCYYIETLSNEMAKLAWQLMQELEGSGGMVKSLRAGLVHQIIAPVAKAKIDAAHKRKDVYVGVNMYANTLEGIVESEKDKSIASHSTATVKLDSGALPKLRAVMKLEELRSSIVKASDNVNTKIFLLNMGSIGEYKARADFATGFFQVGGFEVISPSGYKSVVDAVTEAKQSGASAFCICSTDDNYVSLVHEICSALQGLPIILAGYPQDMIETYRANGVDTFIHIRADVYETLSELASIMGVI
jgi:methylmalonyl-CoA mutase